MQDHLSSTFQALADPTRRAMLARLSKGEANVTDLAKPFLKEMSLPAVTKHLKVLENAGLITKTRDAQWRSCKLNGDPLKEATNWIEQYREFWEESLDRLGEYLKEVQALKKRKEKNMAKSKQPNEIRLIREYDAPLKMVWDAWNDPKQAAKWWGPRGFTITHKSKDLRPGGQWVYTMHGPDGTDWPNIATYHEVEMYSKLVYDHGATPTTPPLFRVTVFFTEKNGKTTIDMSMAFESPERAKEMGKFIKAAGGNGTWDRLAEYLEHEKSGKEEFVINRSFIAPIGKVFDMFTKPEHLSKWLPPTGMKMEYINSPQIKAGAENFYKMGNDQITMFGKIKYLEITPVTHLSYVQSFSDKDGNMGRHPALDVWPNYMHTSITLSDEGEGETRVTIVWTPHGDVSAAEVKAFVDLKAGMTMGWTGSFDKLEEYLSH